MFSSSLRCKNDYLFKMRKTPRRGLLENDVKCWRKLAGGDLFLHLFFNGVVKLNLLMWILLEKLSLPT